ncbi:TPR-like protein, partial [Rozella allomycis CSF55]
ELVDGKWENVELKKGTKIGSILKADLMMQGEAIKKKKEIYEEVLNVCIKLNERIDEGKKRMKRKCLLMMAESYFNLDLKYFGNAKEIYEKLLKQNERDLKVLQGLSRVMSEMKKYEEALKYLKEIIKIDENNEKALSEKAWILLNLERVDEAKEIGIKVLKLKENEINFYRIGRIYWKLKDYEKSFEYFLKSIQLNNSFADPFVYLGHFYLNKDKNRSKKCYLKAISIDQGNEESLKELINLCNQEEILNLIENFHKVNSREQWTWKYLGFLLLKQEKFNESILAFQTSLRLGVKDFECWEGLGEAYKSSGKYLAALKAFERSYEERMKVEVVGGEGVKVEGVGGESKGDNDIQGKETHSLSPSNVSNVIYQMASIKLKLGLIDKAIELFNQIDSNNFILLKLKGLSDCFYLKSIDDLKSGNFNSSISNSKKAIKFSMDGLDLDLKIEFRFLFYKMILDCIKLILKLEIDHSIEEIKVSSRIELIDYGLKLLQEMKTLKFRNLGYLYFEMAYFYKLKLEIDLAIKSVQTAIKYNPKNDKYWNLLGILNIDKDCLFSQHCFIKSLELNKSSESFINLGILYLINNDIELANKCFSNAQTFDPENSVAWFCQSLIAQHFDYSEFVSLLNHSLEISNFDSFAVFEMFVFSSLNKIFNDSTTIKENVLFAAIKVFERNFKLKPNCERVLMLLYEKLNCLDLALNYSHGFDKARILFKLGRINESNKLFSKCFDNLGSSEPGDPIDLFYYHLASNNIESLKLLQSQLPLLHPLQQFITFNLSHLDSVNFINYFRNFENKKMLFNHLLAQSSLDSNLLNKFLNYDFDSNDVDFELKKCQLLMYHGLKNEAIKMAEKISMLENISSDHFQQLAQIYSNSRDYKTSIEFCLKAVEANSFKDSSSLSTCYSLLSFCYSMILVQLSELDVLTNQMDKVKLDVKEDAESVPNSNKSTSTLEKASVAFQNALKLRNNPLVVVDLVNTLVSLGYNDQALSYLTDLNLGDHSGDVNKAEHLNTNLLLFCKLCIGVNSKSVDLINNCLEMVGDNQNARGLVKYAQACITDNEKEKNKLLGPVNKEL